MPEIHIGNWMQLQEELFTDAWQEPLRRFRSQFAFRGHPYAEEQLITGLERLGCNFAQTEPFILRAFRKYAGRAAQFFNGGDSIWNWLALAQHHGLPTRLLDWTYSPNVALHFATDNIGDFERDGVVWCVDYVRANAELPAPLRDVLSRECAGVFTAEMLDEVAKGLLEFDQLTEDEPFVVFLEPPSLDDRIINQFALFSMMSAAAGRLDQWLENHSELVRKLIIPAHLKWEIRDKLDQANTTERVLFPGLDGISRWLKRYYAVRK